VWTTPLLYERLSWPEVRRAAAEERVCLVPVATLEDHGPHMPIDTDLRITAEICRRAAEAAPDDVVLIAGRGHEREQIVGFAEAAKESRVVLAIEGTWSDVRFRRGCGVHLRLRFNSAMNSWHVPQ